MEIKEFTKDKYLISTDQNKLQLDIIHNFLTHSYWAKDINRERVKKSIDNSFCFGVYKADAQIGFARIITDFTTFAYIADVFILEEHRGKGLSKWLMKTILSFDELQNLRGWILKTWDAHGLYKQFGFEYPKYPERIMEFNPGKIQF